MGSTKRWVSVGGDVVRSARAKRSKATAGFTSCGGAGSGEGMDGCKQAAEGCAGRMKRSSVRVAEMSRKATRANEMELVLQGNSKEERAMDDLALMWHSWF